MKIASTIARYLLALVFTVFGLNGFFHFIPQPPPPEHLAVQFMTVMSMSHYFVLVFAIQIAAGLLLFSGRYIPLALALLAPIIVNILLFHSLMNPEGIGAGALVAILWVVLFIRFRRAFAEIFRAKPSPESV